ncbi:2078_t:CDS:2, partial [Gigaspora rosea]
YDYAKVKVIHNAKEVQISQFLPLFSEIIQPVSVVEETIRSLNFQRDEHKESFTHKNYTFLQKILKFDRYIDELDLVILVDIERRKQEKQILRNDIEDLNKVS